VAHLEKKSISIEVDFNYFKLDFVHIWNKNASTLFLPELFCDACGPGAFVASIIYRSSVNSSTLRKEISKLSRLKMPIVEAAANLSIFSSEGQTR